MYLDGRGLSDDMMQAVAKEMNFSETTFVLPPETKGTDVRMRIFTPGAELPMAGHPVIGSTFALARSGVIEPGRKHFVFGLGVGPLSVALKWKGHRGAGAPGMDDDLQFAWMTQLKPVFGEPIADPALAAAALSLSAAAVTGTGKPVQTVSCGVPFLFVPLTTRRAVDSAVLNRAEYDALVHGMSPRPNGVFLFSAERSERATVYSRMFAPDLGVGEDPATGSASGPLGCYLVRHKIVKPGKAGSMVSLQGVKMGRPSHVHIAIGVHGSEISSVQVGGHSVLAGEGTLYV